MLFYTSRMIFSLMNMSMSVNLGNPSQTILFCCFLRQPPPNKGMRMSSYSSQVELISAFSGVNRQSPTLTETDTAYAAGELLTATIRAAFRCLVCNCIKGCKCAGQLEFDSRMGKMKRIPPVRNAQTSCEPRIG